MERVIVKLLENPNNPQLKKKYIGSLEYVVPRTGKDGKLRTGFDENAHSILQISDGKEKEALVKEIVKERKNLEKILGKSLDLDSPFWDNYFVVLDDNEFELDQTNAADRVKEKFLIANNVLAPSREAIDENEDYFDCIYYIHREGEVNTKKAESKKKEHKAGGKLSFMNDEQPEKLKLVASYLFSYPMDSGISIEAAYVKLSEFIDVDDLAQRKKNINIFLEIADKTPEQLRVKLILDKAVNKKIVKVRSGVYSRQDRILGQTYEEALENLATVEYNAELAALSKEIK